MARIRTSSGFTITELLVATGLASAFFLIGASVIQQLFQFQKDVNTRLMDTFAVTNFHRSLTTDLEGSYWHRFGAFSCVSSNALMETNSTANFILSPNGMIEFVTADYSSTIGNVPNTTELTVASMRNLDVGNYVLLSLAADPSIVSLYRVRTVDRDAGRITLDTASLAVAGSSCNFALSSRPLTDFFGATAGSNAILTRIKIVQYRITDGTLTRTALPAGSAENLMDRMNSMSMRSTWAASADGTTAEKQYGQMKFQVVLDHNQSTLMGAKQTSRKQETVVAQYALNSFQYLNRNFTSGSAPITASFPSCSVGFNFRPGSLKVASAHYSDTVPISIAGFVSTDKVKGATIDLTFSARPGAQIDCFKFDPDSSDTPYPNSGSLTGSGMSQTISLAQTATGFDIYTCAVKGTVDVAASMTYFATDINQTKTISCSAEAIEAPTKYQFISTKPTCNREMASYDMGSEMFNTISTGSSVSIGKFGVDLSSSCEWQGQGDSSSDGVADNCDWGSHAGLELRRIYLRPYHQQVYGPDNATPIFSAQGAYINCD